MEVMDMLKGFKEHEPRAKEGPMHIIAHLMNMEGHEDDLQEDMKTMKATVLEGPMTRGRLGKLQEEVHRGMCLLKGQGGPNREGYLDSLLDREMKVDQYLEFFDFDERTKTELKRELRERFVPPFYVRDLYKLKRLYQGSKSVELYSHKRSLWLDSSIPLIGEVESFSPLLKSTLLKEETKLQRENIRCLVLGNIFSFIIDGWSSVNVATLRLVEKLAPPTLPYPKPYKLQ
ncbi:hypothetical protein CR513_44986, partial [Mucuna pruriens]